MQIRIRKQASRDSRHMDLTKKSPTRLLFFSHWMTANSHLLPSLMLKYFLCVLVNKIRYYLILIHISSMKPSQTLSPMMPHENQPHLAPVVPDIRTLSASLINSDDKLFFMSHTSPGSSSCGWSLVWVALGESISLHPDALQDDGKFIVDFYGFDSSTLTLLPLEQLALLRLKAVLLKIICPRRNGLISLSTPTSLPMLGRNNPNWGSKRHSNQNSTYVGILILYNPILTIFMWLGTRQLQYLEKQLYIGTYIPLHLHTWDCEPRSAKPDDHGMNDNRPCHPYGWKRWPPWLISLYSNWGDGLQMHRSVSIQRGV